MAAWSPTLEGFRSVFRQPALPLAEVVWRWSFGAAASILLGLGFIEYLDTLPVSNTDLLLLRTRQPWLISQAFSHILHGSGFRFVLAGVLLFSTLAALWILIASIGRAATLDALLKHIRARAQASQGSTRTIADAIKDGEANEGPAPWRLRSLAGLHFLRAALALAACAGGMGGIILAGFVSSNTHPHPGIVFLLALTIVLLVWLAWSSVSWLLSLASIFVVGQNKDTFAAIASAVALCRDRLGTLIAVGSWFGVAHLVLFIAATSVVMFPLSLVKVLPAGFVLIVVLFLTLAYFAVVDTLYIGRLAGYVAILEAPPVPLMLPVPLAEVPPAGPQFSVRSFQPVAAMVDQDETILSDTGLPDSEGPQ